MAKIVKPENIDEAFICGPEEMIHAVRELEAAGIDKPTVSRKNAHKSRVQQTLTTSKAT